MPIDTMTATAFIYTLTMLSRYFMTIEIRSPIQLEFITIKHVRGVNPPKNPLSITVLPCMNKVVNKLKTEPNIYNQTLDAWMDFRPFFSNASLYTPAKPDIKQYASAMKNPTGDVL